MIAYLLAQLPPDAAADLEVALFRDDRLFAELCCVETELIHAFLRSELTGVRRQRFEEVYSGEPARARRLAAEREWFEAAKLMREKRQRISADSGRRWPWNFWKIGGFRFATASALLAVAAVIVWQSRRIVGFEAAISAMRADLAARSAALQPTASFVLTPGLVRGAAAPKRLLIPGGARLVQFELQLDRVPVRNSYTASLQTVEGLEVWSGSGTRTGDIVVVTLPGALLSRNDYRIALQVVDGDGKATVLPSYLFSVSGVK